MSTEKSAVERMARALAFIAVTKSLGESGVLAINPQYVAERVDAVWKDYIFYLKPEYFRLIPIIDAAVQTHPEGLVGLTKDIDAAWEAHQKTLPELDF